MAKLHARPSNQYRYEHYDPLLGGPVRTGRLAIGRPESALAGRAAPTAKFHHSCDLLLVPRLSKAEK